MTTLEILETVWEYHNLIGLRDHLLPVNPIRTGTFCLCYEKRYFIGQHVGGMNMLIKEVIVHGAVNFTSPKQEAIESMHVLFDSRQLDTPREIQIPQTDTCNWNAVESYVARFIAYAKYYYHNNNQTEYFTHQSLLDIPNVFFTADTEFGDQKHGTAFIFDDNITDMRYVHTMRGKLIRLTKYAGKHTQITRHDLVEKLENSMFKKFASYISIKSVE